MDKVSLADKLAQFSDQWSPKVVSRLDGYEIKLVKQQNDFVWHKHDGEDEMFLVIEESMTIDFHDRAVSLEPGEYLAVPKGVKHKPHAEIAC